MKLVIVDDDNLVSLSLKTILEACNREMAGPTAPAQGLTLMGIEFFD